MIKAEEFDNILNECLDRIFKGETIESCLKLYPESADELERLLTTALKIHQAADFKPSPEFRQRAANEFQDALRNMPVKKSGGGFKWQLGWVAPVAIVAAILAGGSGTVLAATNALPDSPLYGVKMAAESVQMAFTFSDDAKTELYSKFVDYRVGEIIAMSKAGNYKLVTQTTDRMNRELAAMAGEDYNVAADNGKAAFNLMTQSQVVTSFVNSPPQTVITATVTTPASVNSPPGPTNLPGSEYRNLQTTGNATGTESLVAASANIDDLKLLLTSNYQRSLKNLLEQYEQASEELKPFIQRAIDILTAGYEQALANLG